MRIEAVLFDLDGTLVESPLDWSLIRSELGAGEKPLLSYLQELDEPERAAKRGILEGYEDAAARRAVLRPGIREFLLFLKERGIKTALVTNNSGRNTTLLIRKFGLEFDCVVTRDLGLWKPSGAPLLAALESVAVERETACAVGDSTFDVRAAQEAGIPMVFLLPGRHQTVASPSVVLCESVSDLHCRFQSLLT